GRVRRREHESPRRDGRDHRDIRRGRAPRRAGEGRELAPARPHRGRLSAAARREAGRQRGRPARVRRPRPARLQPGDGRRDPALTRPERARPGRREPHPYTLPVAKVEALRYGDRRVFTVTAFNRGVAIWLRRLPDVWVEGELTELRRNDAWGSVFFTLKDPQTGACLRATMLRRRFDALSLELADGEKVHVQGRAEVYEQRGELGFRATTIERLGLGEHLAALERLKQRLAAEGLFAAERKRPLPRFPRAVGLLTGADAAARGDLVTAIATRFPPARLVVAETRVQGAGAAE